MIEAHRLALDLLLHVEPSNMQAQSLKALIDQAETREGYIGEWRRFCGNSIRHAERFWNSGIGLVAGAAALGGLVVASLYKQARRR